MLPEFPTYAVPMVYRTAVANPHTGLNIEVRPGIVSLDDVKPDGTGNRARRLAARARTAREQAERYEHGARRTWRGNAAGPSPESFAGLPQHIRQRALQAAALLQVAQAWRAQEQAWMKLLHAWNEYWRG